jgi:hypothetical protein
LPDRRTDSSSHQASGERSFHVFETIRRAIRGDPA